MATTTPNFGWPVPTSTDLVKDGAVAIEGLGDAIDASLLDLKGGTTNQVLAKNSNTDMDFKWVADASGIPATIFDAKGDLIAASAADTAARLPVGTNGQVLTADSAESTGLKWATASSSSGLTFINKTTFTGVSSVSVPNDTFTTTYDNYKAILTVNSTSANAALSIRMRTSGTDNTSADYIGAMTGLSFQNVVNNNVSASATAWNLGTPQNGGTPRLQFELGFIRPKLVEISNLNVHGTAGDANGLVVGSMWFNTATAFDAFTFLVASGTMAGTIRVYGYQN